MAKAPLDIRSLARQQTVPALHTLSRIMQHGESESARVLAANSLLDRGWGKPAQAHTGADGDGPIAFVVRHILEHPGDQVELKVIEAKQVEPGET